MRIIFSVLILSLAACANTAAIDRGQALFLGETFNGNGRTCGSCHMPVDGFGISPKTIASLPADHPFFAVNVPGLEDADLLRTLGLVRVSDKDEDGVNEFRPTPGLGGMKKLCTAKGKCAVLGQRGDRETDLCTFSNEAIGNHLTKRPGGVAGVDFRLMSAQECKDLIAYLRSDRVSKP
jgi:hypothetical protein